jgi:DMSO/TMAO reductase YedYZ molybdopterin-dependent catalytic subunit
MNQPTRRNIIKGGIAVAGLGILNVPEWVLPVLAQGETVVPFTDIPENVRWETPPDRRTLDVRTIDGPFTPPAKFATTQHYGHPEVDPATFKLKVSGMVNKPLQLSLDDLKKMGSAELVAGFECSGNRGPLQGLCGNGKWTGLPLKKVLDAAGVQAEAREFVFFGADKGEEEVEWRTQKYKIDVPFGRSLNREKALSAEPFLTYALNGEPLTKHQGAPLRLLVPGWYGVANVKWLSQIHVQEDAYLGKYQARWYRTVRGRNDRRRNEIHGEGRHAYEPEVVHRAGDAQRRQLQGAGRHPERWHADQVGRSESRRG